MYQVNGDLQPVPWPSSEQLARDPAENYGISARQNIRPDLRSSQSGGLPATAHSPGYPAIFTSHSQSSCSQLYITGDWQIQQRGMSSVITSQFRIGADLGVLSFSYR